MEQQSTSSANITQENDLSWFTSRCRSLVLNALNKIENAGLEIEENGQITFLGNENSELRGKLIVLDPSLYVDFIKGGSIAAAEAYIAKKWTSQT
jgi:cyclopropane-fatty-acyl-phospholipid synthase